MDTNRLKMFSKRYFLLQRLKAKQKELQDWINKEQESLIDHLVDEGIDKVSLAGGTTVYIKTLIWAKYENKQAAIKAIKESDIKDLIEEGFNAQRLSAYLRELDAEGKPLPDSFKGVISPNPTHSLIARKY